MCHQVLFNGFEYAHAGASDTKLKRPRLHMVLLDKEDMDACSYETAHSSSPQTYYEEDDVKFEQRLRMAREMEENVEAAIHDIDNRRKKAISDLQSYNLDPERRRAQVRVPLNLKADLRPNSMYVCLSSWHSIRTN